MVTETNYEQIAEKLRGEGFCGATYRGQICTSKVHDRITHPVHESTDSTGKPIKRWMTTHSGDTWEL